MIMALILQTTYSMQINYQFDYRTRGSRRTISNEEQKQLNTELRDAAFAGKFETVEKLLAEGAEIDAAVDQGHTALYFAVSGGMFGSPVHTVNLLLEKGADPNLATKQGTTPLHVAYQNNRETIQDALKAKHANQKAEDSWGHIPSDYPLIIKKKKKRCLNCFRFVRRKNADLNTELIPKI